MVSRLAYGLWRLAEDPQGAAPAIVEAKIQACLAAGITTFDHADIYGGYTCEGLFGRVLKSKPALRDQIQIVTKCGINAPGEHRAFARVKHYDATAVAIEQCVDRSLRELGTDRIDLLLVHRPDWLTRAEDTAAGLNRLLRSGKILHAGVSNFSTDQFELLNASMEKPLVTNQVEVSLLQMKAIYDGTLNQCERLRIRPMVWSPTGGGRLFHPQDTVAVRLRAQMTALSAKYNGAELDQLALAWLLALPSQPVIVIGTNRVERIASAADAVKIELDRQDWYALWTAAAGQPVP